LPVKARQKENQDMSHKPHRDRTLQDDRAELNVDAHDGSPLTEGEAAPRADEGTATPTSPLSFVKHLFIGGAPVAVTPEDTGESAPHDPLTFRAGLT
jgi:hypothetical protein